VHYYLQVTDIFACGAASRSLLQQITLVLSAKHSQPSSYGPLHCHLLS